MLTRGLQISLEASDGSAGSLTHPLSVFVAEVSLLDRVQIPRSLPPAAAHSQSHPGPGEWGPHCWLPCHLARTPQVNKAEAPDGVVHPVLGAQVWVQRVTWGV